MELLIVRRKRPPVGRPQGCPEPASRWGLKDSEVQPPEVGQAGPSSRPVGKPREGIWTFPPGSGEMATEVSEAQ